MRIKRSLQIIIFMISVWLFISCETGASTEYDETLTMFCYAKADSTIDSLYLTRTGGVNESINLSNLGVSNATIELFERSPIENDYTLIGTLSEYPDRKGIYYLPEIDFPAGFKVGYSYIIKISHPDYNEITAETVCPPELTSVTVINTEAQREMISMTEDPGAVDTLYYRRGESFDDIRLVSCGFDSLSIIVEERLASFKLVPDEICRTDTSFWLEDTTKTVWEDYPIETQIFKRKERFGQNTTEYFLRSMSIYWYNLFHEGMHTIIFSSTDRVFRSYMETHYSEDGRYTNVINGLGLFTISNSSAVRSRYRVYVKSLENKYPD